MGEEATSHNMPAGDAFVRKLETFGALSARDRNLIQSLCVGMETYRAGADIIREGDRPSDVNLVTGGIAFRYKLLTSGTRQIVAILMPGDICDLHVTLLDVMDHSIAALTEVQLVKLPRDTIVMLLDRPAISRALLMVTMANEANGREWLVNIGARPADERVAHFLCEWHLRLQSVGLADGDECVFPLTQSQLGEATGLSVVHINRTLQALREAGLIALNARRLRLLDRERLWDMSGFRQNYLHLLGKKFV